MNPERYRRACELLARAFELPPGERPGYIRAECGDDAELFLEASSLLSYAVDGETDNPASRFALSPVVEPEEALNGTRVGRFQLTIRSSIVRWRSSFFRHRWRVHRSPASVS
jgi:hypothetical protein